MSRKIGARIRELRKLRGISQEALARRTGLSRPYLSTLERTGGANPTVETLAILAEALGTALGDFFEGEDAPQGKGVSPSHAEGRKAPVFDPGKGRDICASIFQSVSDEEYPAGQAGRFEPCGSRDPNAFYVVARGKSMTGGAGRRQRGVVGEWRGKGGYVAGGGRDSL